MFGIGGFELFIILVFGFLIFGPDKLPEIAKTVGKGIARFREAQREMNDTLGGEKIFDPNNPDEPFKNPVEVLDRMAQRQEEKKAGKTSGAKPAGRVPGKSAGKPVGASVGKPAEMAEAGEPAEKAGADKLADASRQESFTERKARYERERAARRAAEANVSSEEAPVGARSARPADSPESAKVGVATDGEDVTADAPATIDAPAPEGGDA